MIRVALAMALTSFAGSAFAQQIILRPNDGTTSVIETFPTDDGPSIIELEPGSNGAAIVETTPGEDGAAIIETMPGADGTGMLSEDVPANDVRALAGNGVALKGLDKVSGEVADVDLKVGETAPVGRLEVTLGECRFPEDNPAGEGYAWLTIRDASRDAVLFDGWMVASSPALNALDHPRYDVWVIRCTTA